MKHPTPSRGFPRSIAITVLALVLGLALSSPTSAAGTDAPPPAAWWRAESPDFTLFTDAGPDAGRQAAENLQQLRGFLLEIAPSGRFESPAPFRVYLFDDTEELVRFQPRGGTGAGFVVPGAFGVTGAAIWVDDGGNPGRFLYKQYLHWVLHENLPELPEWFRQGLAEYYATFRVEDGEAKVGLPVEDHVRWLRASLGGAQLRLVDQELGAEGTAFHPVSWALVHYLVVGNDQTRPRVVDWVRRVVAGDDPTAAFQDVFGESREAMVARLRGYVLGDRFRYLRVPVSSLALPQVVMDGMTPAEVEYRLGELLLLTADGFQRRIDAAEARFRRALELAPGQPGATAALGRLAAERGDAEEALAAYEKAVAAGGDDFLLQYLLGDALVASLQRRRPATDEERATLERAIAALRRTTELAPDLAAGWERLGFALNLQPRASDEAVTALVRALGLAPDRPDVVLNLLLAHARLGQADAVEGLTLRLAALGADAQTLRGARETRLRLLLHEAEALAREDRLDDAVALLARVRAETTDPSLAETAAAQLQLVARAAQHNRYAELYQRAAERLAAGDPAAREVLAELAATARPGVQTEAVAALAARLGEAADAGFPEAP